MPRSSTTGFLESQPDDTGSGESAPSHTGWLTGSPL